jgi:hypothetical protein
MAMSVKASEGEIQRAVQLLEASNSLRSCAQLSARKSRLSQAGLGSLLRVAWAN